MQTPGVCRCSSPSFHSVSPCFTICDTYLTPWKSSEHIRARTFYRQIWHAVSWSQGLTFCNFASKGIQWFHMESNAALHIVPEPYSLSIISWQTVCLMRPVLASVLQESKVAARKAAERARRAQEVCHLWLMSKIILMNSIRINKSIKFYKISFKSLKHSIIIYTH